MTTDYDAAAFDSFEAAAWTRRADAYAQQVMALTAGGVDPLLDAADIGPGLRVLDVGCGPGTVSAAAVARGAEVTGVDAAEPMVRIAAQRVPQATFRVATASALPAGDGEYDRVVAGFVLLHVGAPELVAAEAARVCAPGGRVAFSVWDDLAVNRVLGVVQDAVARVGDELTPVDVPPGPAFTRFADDAAMRGLLTGAGLRDPVVSRHRWDHVVDADVWWDAVLRGTARTAAVIEAQGEAVRRRIRSVYDELVAPYARPDGTLGLPAAMVVGSAARP